MLSMSRVQTFFAVSIASVLIGQAGYAGQEDDGIRCREVELVVDGKGTGEKGELCTISHRGIFYYGTSPFLSLPRALKEVDSTTLAHCNDKGLGRAKYVENFHSNEFIIEASGVENIRLGTKTFVAGRFLCVSTEVEHSLIEHR